MKKLLSIFLILMIILCFAACGGSDEPDTPDVDDPVQQDQQQENEGSDEAEQQDDSQLEQQTPDDTQSDESQSDEDIPAAGKPLDWPENDYTALIPTPDEGGKVLAANEIGTLFSVELNWEMEKGIAYAQKLRDAGFGDDCVEKYEQYGYIDRTANGVNVQLLDMFGQTSISIMPVEE
ncbi:MAG: hypothetical protein IKM19_03260 [Firmicutes bacterium]|nr:hypothetical protein [Bacillota bacterium]